jgi:hypothetical protein
MKFCFGCLWESICEAYVRKWKLRYQIVNKFRLLSRYAHICYDLIMISQREAVAQELTVLH